MYIYIYTYIYVYIYVCVCVCVCACVWWGRWEGVCTHICRWQMQILCPRIGGRVRGCMLMYMYMYIIWMFGCLSLYPNSYIPSRMYPHTARKIKITHTHTHIYIYIYIYIYEGVVVYLCIHAYIHIKKWWMQIFSWVRAHVCEFARTRLHQYVCKNVLVFYFCLSLFF